MTKLTSFLAIAAAALAGSSCREVHGEAPAAPRPVKTMAARATAAPAGIRYAVSIQPYQQIPLSFKSSGYIDAVQQRRGADGRVRPLQGGDAVAAGTVLARGNTHVCGPGQLLRTCCITAAGTAASSMYGSSCAKSAAINNTPWVAGRCLSANKRSNAR